MASSKAPKHDFAPAWLKIPNQESSKSDRGSVRVGDRENRGRRDDYHRGGGGAGQGGSGGGGPPASNSYHTDYLSYPLPRQRSFDSYEADHHRPFVHANRHNSFEDDYHYHARYHPQHQAAGYHNGYDDVDRYSNQYRSQPLLHRTPPSRDSRPGDVRHQGPRYPSTQINGHGYPGPGYYDYQLYDPHSYPRGGNSRDEPDRYYNGYPPSRGRANSSSDYLDRKESIASKDRQTNDTDKQRTVKLEEEFPSLNGDADSNDQKSTVSTTPSATTGKGESAKNAWETPPKVQKKSLSRSEHHHSPGSPDLTRKENDKPSSTSIYKALVPSKSVSSRHKSRHDSSSGGSGNSNTSGNNSSNSSSISTNGKLSNNKLTNGKLHGSMTGSASSGSGPGTPGNVNSTNKYANNREASSRISPTPPTAEILSKRIITQPKNMGDKKSEFLRTLKKSASTNNSSVTSIITTSTTTSVKSPSGSERGSNTTSVASRPSSERNGRLHDINSNDRSTLIDSSHRNDRLSDAALSNMSQSIERLSVTSTDHLSSSLEAEQRLLREMGWKETDEEEEEYVITEDDKKFVEDQMKQCPQRNGVVKPAALQLKSWSPRHLSFPPMGADDLNEVLSSSSYSDSDSD